MDIYTDGSCLGNPGRGGWGFIAYRDGVETHRSSGNEWLSTNNIMELTALDNALAYVEENALADDADVVVHTDSNYVKQGITSWIKNWVKNDFKTSFGKDVKNKYLWMSIYEKKQRLGSKVDVRWVRAHDGNPMNEAVDALARSEAHSARIIT